MKRFRAFIGSYLYFDYTRDHLMERLDSIYDFFDSSSSAEERIQEMILMLEASKWLFEDVNEMKTLLIITKNIGNPYLQVLRGELLNRFESEMKKITK